MTRPNNVNTAEDRYSSGAYMDTHPDWHLPDSPGKALDIWPVLKPLVSDYSGQTLRIVEVGTGTGGVLHETGKILHQNFPDQNLELHGFDIASSAIELGKAQFPEIQFHQRFFTLDDGPFDVTLLIDVLEHLENPWEMLRIVAAASRFLIVRQPLLGNFSTFRHDNYRTQRNHWGHIAYFNIYSFCDMAESTGWRPTQTILTAPWELKTNPRRGRAISRLLTRINRNLSSFFLSGFYLIGSFEQTDVRKTISDKS